MSTLEPTTPDGDKSDPPLWRQHFPIETAAESQRTRREFAAGLAVAGGAMLCGQAALNGVSPAAESTDPSLSEVLPPLKLEKNFQDLKAGEAFLFHYPDHKSPCILIKFSEDKFSAFAQKCTHLACPVIPDIEADRFQCPCHKGSFDIRTGEPLAGPPRSALARVRMQLQEDGTLTANGFGAA